MIVLEHDYGIIQEIRHVNVASFAEDLRVFLHHKPAHVSEEEPAQCVVGVSVGLCVLVVDAVVTGPLEDVVLHRYTVEEHKHYLVRESRFVRLVRPVAMGPSSHPQTTNEVVQTEEDPRLPLHERGCKYSHHAQSVDEDDEGDVAPHDLRFESEWSRPFVPFNDLQ